MTVDGLTCSPADLVGPACVHVRNAKRYPGWVPSLSCLILRVFVCSLFGNNYSIAIILIRYSARSTSADCACSTARISE